MMSLGPYGDSLLDPPPPPPPPPPPAPPAGARPSRRGRLVAVAVLVLLAAGAGAAFLLRDDGPTYPDAWEPDVRPLADFVADARDLEFEHPVTIEFLEEEEYGERRRTDESELTDEDRAEIDSAEAQMRALGLAGADVDLFEAVNDLGAESSLAFYDFEEERVVVRGTEFTPALRTTLVHELVHVLQDQHFGIDEDRFEDLETEGSIEAFRAIVEGDASRIEDEYVASLSAAEQESYDTESDEDGAEARADLAEVPSALVALQQAPYLFGPQLLALVEAEGGNRAVDDLLQNPPSSAEQLYDLTAYFDDDEPVDVDTPALPDGVEESVDDGDFGYAGWLLVLGDRIDPLTAMEVADAWGGDAYVIYEVDGRTCTRIAYVGDTAEATDEMAAALDEWVATMPPGSSSTFTEGDAVVLQSCDPREDVKINDRSLEVIQLPLVRAELAKQAVEGADPGFEKAFEFGQCAIDELGWERFAVIAGSEGEPPPEVLAGLEQSMLGCASSLFR